MFLQSKPTHLSWQSSAQQHDVFAYYELLPNYSTTAEFHWVLRIIVLGYSNFFLVPMWRVVWSAHASSLWTAQVWEEFSPVENPLTHTGAAPTRGVVKWTAKRFSQICFGPHHVSTPDIPCKTASLFAAKLFWQNLNEWVWCMECPRVCCWVPLVESTYHFKQQTTRGTESESKKVSRKPRSFDQSGSLKSGMRFGCFRVWKPAGGYLIRQIVYNYWISWISIGISWEAWHMDLYGLMTLLNASQRYSDVDQHIQVNNQCWRFFIMHVHQHPKTEHTVHRPAIRKSHAWMTVSVCVCVCKCSRDYKTCIKHVICTYYIQTCMLTWWYCYFV